MNNNNYIKNNNNINVYDINNNNNIINKFQCSMCLGVGLIKKNIIICKYCNGNKCIRCGESGFYQKPYETCQKCDGLGNSNSQINSK